MKRVKYFRTELRRMDLNVSGCSCNDAAFGDTPSIELTETVLIFPPPNSRSSDNIRIVLSEPSLSPVLHSNSYCKIFY